LYGLDNGLSAGGGMAWGVLLFVSVGGGFKALDIVEPSLEERANKVGEAVRILLARGTENAHEQTAYKAMKAKASNVFLSEHLLTKRGEFARQPKPKL
jgi:hypothetical protein